jgi:hypothetical protein
MKAKVQKLLVQAAFLLAFSLLNLQLSTGFAQGTAFTYQGQLDADGAPYTGLAEIQLSLWTGDTGGSQVGSTLTASAVGVTNGLVTVTLDFGLSAFSGGDRWLQLAVRTNGAASFATLSPRQPLTPTPYAIMAGNVVSGGLPATYSSPVTFNNTANSFTGSGAGLTGLDADSLASGTVPESALGNAWKIGGNAGTSPANGNFLGTTDFQPLDLKAGGMRVLRLEPDARTNVSGLSGNLIGGYINNVIEQPGSGGDFIGGGGYPAGPNVIHSNSAGVFIGAGSANQIGPNVNDAVIGGGYGNTILSYDGVIAGGENNTISSNATFAGIPGGYANVAAGQYSLAAGRQAKANHEGAFVWSDATGLDFSSTRSNEFSVRATGGVRFVTGGAGMTIDGVAVPVPQATVADPNHSNIVNVVEGSSANDVAPGIYGATISGGGAASYNSFYVPNMVTADFGSIGGGEHNTSSGVGSTIAGGVANTASGIGSTIGGGSFEISSGSYSVVGGGFGNSSAGDYATVGGGYGNACSGAYATVAGGTGNMAGATNATISGGGNNSIQSEAGYSVIAGGLQNAIQAVAYDANLGGYNSTIGGGLQNTINSPYATIGGGSFGDVGTNANSGTIGGGYGNAIGDNAYDSTITGGAYNTASGNGSTVSGGHFNTAAGANSFAAGYDAQALHDGSFVWADDTGAAFASTAANQFLIRAGSGVGINTASPGAALEVRTSNPNGNEIRFGYNGGGAGNLIAGSTYVGIATDDLVTRLAIRQSSGDVGIGTVSPDASLSVNGTADKPGGGSWSTFSDSRLKDVGASFTNGLAALERIQPVHYHYKTDNPLKLPSRPEYVGVVAQQVQTAIPEAIQRSRTGYLVVNNDPIIWTMVNAIKELKANNDALQQRVKRLEKEVALRSGSNPDGGAK